MTFLFSKKYTINLFIEIKNILHHIILNDNPKDQNNYNIALHKIIKILSITLKKIEDIYYIHFLEPKLKQHYNNKTQTE